MQTSRTLLGFLCVVSLAGGAWAQVEPTATTAPALPTPEPVITHIPAGAMGFVVVNNIQESINRVEKLLTEIGLGSMVGLGPESPGLVGMLKMQAQLGEGFNPNGGFAVVLLDPQQFGIDLLQMMNPRPPVTTQPTEQPPSPKDLPILLFVPGRNLSTLLPGKVVEEAGQFKKIYLNVGEMYAYQRKGYVVLSPSVKALKAMLEAKPALSELTTSQREAIAKSGVAVHVNMKIAGPIYINLLKQVQTQMTMMSAAMPAPARPLFALSQAYIPMYREMISQMDSITLTAIIAETGLVFSETLIWSPESDWGQMIASYKPITGGIMDKLPNLPYVLAIASTGASGQAKLQKFTEDMVAKLMPNLPAPTDAKLKSIIQTYYDQVLGFQFVAGGSPEGCGVFGIGWVVKCKDSEVVKTLLADKISIADDLIKALLGEEASQELGQLKFAYVKDAEKLGGLSVDAIDITHPKLQIPDEIMDPNELARKRNQLMPLWTALGEERVRLRITAPDKNTVVVTLGGADKFMSEAIKATKTPGTILKGAGSLEAMKYIPAKPTGVMLFNVGNLFEVIAKGTMMMKPGGAPLPFAITTRVPIAAGVAMVQNEMRIGVYVPTALIKEAAGIVMGLMFRPQPVPPVPPTGGAGEF